ncbi:7590_t:CDS:10, partial [Scutellospora calospora]
VVKLNQIFNWFVNNDEQLKLIRIDQITPLYKILDYKLQNEIEMILENRLDYRILLTGVKTFDVDVNYTEAYVRINFDKNSVLDSRSYDVFGLVFDNKDVRSEIYAIKFDLFDCYGFSAFVTFKDNTAKNVKGWLVFNQIKDSRPSFSANHRETNIAFHKALVDSTMCFENIIYISLPFTLVKNCIVLFSASYSSNNPPKQNLKLLGWSKDGLKLKIMIFDKDQPQPSPFYLKICIIYPCEMIIFNVDIGEKLVTYDLFGQNLDIKDYDQTIDFNCYKNIYLKYLDVENIEFPVKHTKYLCSSDFDLIQRNNSDIPFEAYFIQEVDHDNLVKYINILETETTFILITELVSSIQLTNWKTLHDYLKHNGALSENQAKNIFKQVIECIYFIYKHGFFNINISDKNIFISESQRLVSDDLNEDLVYDIQYENDYSISYASPEMITGHNYNPEFSDLWSLGILLYTMIHAYVPFKKPFDTIASTLVLHKVVSEGCTSIIHRLLAKKPHLRGSFKYLLNDPWIGIKTFSKSKFLNKLKGNVNESIAIEKTSHNKIMQELCDLIEESQIGTIGPSLPLRWIQVNSLNDIKLIGKGGFGSVFSAIWTNKSTITQTSNKLHFYHQRTSTKVALKECSNAHENDGMENFLREMKNHTKINGLWGIIDFYGIACGHKPDDLKMVLHYADKSDLNEYLARNFISITWKEKLSIILDIAVGLYQIHKIGIIHRDIHPGNIFLDSSISCIGDFGLSQEADILTDNNRKLFGIATGKHMHGSKSNNKPSFDESIPLFYQTMIHSCCDKEPSNRPNAQTLANEIIDWKLNKMHQFNDKKVLISYMTEETGEKSQSDIAPDPENDENDDIYSKVENDGMKSNVVVEYLKKAADGDPEAMKNVAICFLTGTGVEKNMNAAFSWCMKCFNNKIKFTHEELIPLVEHVSQDFPDLGRKIKYGMMLQCGLGVDKDLTKAYLIYKSAAESGDARAQFKTGRFCEEGWGREKNLREAFSWFKKAIEQNNPEAWNHLNKCYMTSFKLQGKGITKFYTAHYNKFKVTGMITAQFDENYAQFL